MILNLLQYTAAFMLGVLISVMLSGAGTRDLCARRTLLICVLLLAGQMGSFLLFGLSVTKRLYPLIVHLPLWALLVFLLKTPKLQTAVSVLAAYMCCQPPRWVASMGLLIPETHWIYSVLYLPAAGIFLLLVHRYLAAPLCQFMGRSRKACLLMGIVPALYYVFDYVTTVYTSLLISGNMAAVQFMPSMLAMVYLVFVIMYHAELEKQMRLSAQRDLLALQLNQSKLAFSAMQQVQEKTMEYRHDMRHHFTLLRTLAAQNNMLKIQEYLSTAEQDMEALTPVRYCTNEVVNLLLSYYAAQAKAQQVDLAVTAVLPSQLHCSETELCSLLSNGLENAIHAAAQVEPANPRSVSIHLGIHGENLLIQIENSYTGELTFQDGLPCAGREGHGLGARSIRTIVRAHGGEALFRAQNGRFQLRILLPENPVQTDQQHG